MSGLRERLREIDASAAEPTPAEARRLRVLAAVAVVSILLVGVLVIDVQDLTWSKSRDYLRDDWPSLIPASLPLIGVVTFRWWTRR